MSTPPPITPHEATDAPGPGLPGALGRTAAALRRALRPGRLPRSERRDLDDCVGNATAGSVTPTPTSGS